VPDCEKVTLAETFPSAGQDGGAQIEYEDQDPRIHLEYLRQMKKNGAQSKMGTLLNEEPYLKKLAAEG